MPLVPTEGDEPKDRAEKPDLEKTLGDIKARFLSGSVEAKGAYGVMSRASQAIPQEKAARVLKLQGRLGLDPDLIGDNLDEVEEIAKTVTDPEEFLKRHPKVGEWLTRSPHHMAVLRPDLPAVDDLTKLFRRQDDPSRPLSLYEIEGQADRLSWANAPKEFEQFQFFERHAYVDDFGRNPYPGPHVGSVEEMQKALRERYLAELKDEESYIRESDSVGFFESVGHAFRQNPLFMLPFVSSGVEAGKSLELYQAAKAVEAGN